MRQPSETRGEHRARQISIVRHDSKATRRSVLRRRRRPVLCDDARHLALVSLGSNGNTSLASSASAASECALRRRSRSRPLETRVTTPARGGKRFAGLDLSAGSALGYALNVAGRTCRQPGQLEVAGIISGPSARPSQCGRSVLGLPIVEHNWAGHCIYLPISQCSGPKPGT